MTHNCKEMHKISLLKIAEVVRQKKSPNARTTGSLLNCILSKVLSKYSFCYYCNTDTWFKVQRIRRCTGSPAIPGSPACPLSPGLPEDPGEPCGPGNPVAPGDP